MATHDDEIGNPQLTAQRFVPNPFHPGEHFYKTGDRVRRCRNTEFGYRGRLDHQMKIRGHRMKTREISAVLSRYPGREATVQSREQNGETRLAAHYVRGDAALVVADLRSFAGHHLQSYMSPEAFVWLESLPLTVNGKLDERALPEREAISATSEQYTKRPARNRVLAQILDTWRNVLRTGHLGPEDDVFDYGAHSILAVRVRNELQQALGREISVVLLFQCPTAVSLSIHLQSNAEHGSAQPDTSQRGLRRGVVQQERRRRAVGASNEGD